MPILDPEQMLYGQYEPVTILIFKKTFLFSSNF